MGPSRSKKPRFQIKKTKASSTQDKLQVAPPNSTMLPRPFFKTPHPVQQCCHALSSSCPTQFNNIATPFLQVAPFNSTMLPHPFFKTPQPYFNNSATPTFI